MPPLRTGSLPAPPPGDMELHRARRAFVRAHHPDRGGDPAAFVAGLAGFDRLLAAGSAQRVSPAGSGPPGHPGPVTVLRRPRTIGGWLRHLSGLTAAAVGARPARHSRVH